ncbi:unnamed protein product [Urochloa humidicola]
MEWNATLSLAGLTPAAEEELMTVNSLLGRTMLVARPDVRQSPFILPDGRLQTSSIYKMLKASQGECSPSAGIVWCNHAPPRIRFFAWLLTSDRIQSRVNLRRKNILDDDTCELCHGCPETLDHIVFHCPTARLFWQTLGFQLDQQQQVQELHQLPRPSDIPADEYETFILLCCWQLWKRRNEVVFRGETMTMRQLLHSCRDEVRLWECRLPRASQSVSNAWCTLFVNAM